MRSPSSRRAWIEIIEQQIEACRKHVALLAEGVDRNRTTSLKTYAAVWSPSSRRAWIEIGADRHWWLDYGGRPPRGGRG